MLVGALIPFCAFPNLMVLAVRFGFFFGRTLVGPGRSGRRPAFAFALALGTPTPDEALRRRRLALLVLVLASVALATLSSLELVAQALFFTLVIYCWTRGLRSRRSVCLFRPYVGSCVAGRVSDQRVLLLPTR